MPPKRGPSYVRVQATDSIVRRCAHTCFPLTLPFLFSTAHALGKKANPFYRVQGWWVKRRRGCMGGWSHGTMGWSVNSFQMLAIYFSVDECQRAVAHYSWRECRSKTTEAGSVDRDKRSSSLFARRPSCHELGIPDRCATADKLYNSYVDTIRL